MFELLDGDMDINEFKWASLGDITSARENLGEKMPVIVYRMFQYAMRDVLAKRYGNEELIAILREAGEVAGRGFALNMLPLDLPLQEFIAKLQEVLKDMQIGILRIERFDEETGKLVITIAEDLDCSGLPVVGTTVCNYDEGFLAGILSVYTKKEYIVVEVDCWATGARVCRFNAFVDEK